MVLFVLGFVALSLWAVVVDTLGPIILHGSKTASLGCFLLTCIFLLEVNALCSLQELASFRLVQQELPLIVNPAICKSSFNNAVKSL